VVDGLQIEVLGFQAPDPNELFGNATSFDPTEPTTEEFVTGDGSVANAYIHGRLRMRSVPFRS